MRSIKFILFFIAVHFIFGLDGYAQEGKKPNVIFIFPDQYRNFSLGFWSQDDNSQYIQGDPDPVHTPALDKLADESLVFSRAMSNYPLCSPFRGMLMTGKYPTTNGIEMNCHKSRTDGVKMDGKAIANVFNEGGYETAYFGKCHWVKTEPLFDEEGTYVGTSDSPGGHYVNAYDTYVPAGEARLGYEYFFQMISSNHFNSLCYSNDPKTVEGRKDGELYRPKRFSADIESEVLINYLENTHNQRDTDKPFFITWALNPPHNPWTEENTDMTFFPKYINNGKADIEKLLARENADKDVGSYAPYYFANVSSVDFYIGKVLDKLEELGIDDNTIVVFTSDHGEMLGSHGRTGKTIPEIESSNIPLMVKWTGKIEHRVEDLMFGAPDFMPTLLALAGFENEIPEDVQGKNYSDVFINGTASKIKKPKSVLFFNMTSRGLHTGDYTFVVESNKKGAFKNAYYYDNVNDPYQMNRIEGSRMDSKLKNKMKSELVSQLQAIGDRWAKEKTCSEYLKY